MSACRSTAVGRPISRSARIRRGGSWASLRRTRRSSGTTAWCSAFAERANRDRTLFFEQQAGLDEWLGSADLLVKADAARRDIDAGKLPDTSPIVSIEPEAYVDFESNFYMLPILEAKSKRLPTGFRVREVKIASVTREEAKPVTEQPLRRRVNPDALNNFRAGVVFVIDASSSMQPYIARTRWVMEDVLKRVEAAGLADRVRFGLVGYRDDPAKVPDIEYLTRTFADPNKIKGADDFKLAVEPLAASKVSTRDLPRTVSPASTPRSRPSTGPASMPARSS